MVTEAAAADRRRRRQGGADGSEGRSQAAAGQRAGLLPALGPARQGGLAGDLGALLLGELAGASGAALAAAEAAEVDGSRVLGAFACRGGGGDSDRLRRGQGRISGFRLVIARGLGHARSMRLPPGKSKVLSGPASARAAARATPQAPGFLTDF